MKITKKEAQKIAKIYDLGEVKSFKEIKGGLVNHNFDLKTGKGEFIIRLVSDNSVKKLKHLKLQFEVLAFLKKSNFPYLIPNPLKNKDSKEISIINGKKIWVYKTIDGTNYDRPNIVQIRQMARALATYHKFIKDFNGSRHQDNSLKRITEGFKKMQKINGKGEADKLALKYGGFFKKVFDKINIKSYNENSLFLHSDFDSSNVLFNKGKLIAFIDFDELNYGPRIFDVAISLRDSCYSKGKIDLKKIKIFLKEYERIIKLSENEKKMIIPIILYINVDFFVWAYVYMKKEKENRKKYMKEMISLTKDIVENNIEIK